MISSPLIRYRPLNVRPPPVPSGVDLTRQRSWAHRLGRWIGKRHSLDSFLRNMNADTCFAGIENESCE